MVAKAQPSATEESVMKRSQYVVVAVAAIALALGGCNKENCGDSCSSDDDCDGSLVCYSGTCAPSECETSCSNYGINVCSYNKATCEYVGCN
jgi:hypothetical protein